MLNESPDNPTFGVHVQPSSTGDHNLILEIIRTNSNVTPGSYGLLVMMQDGHCEAVSDGTHVATYFMNGTNTKCNVISSEGTMQSGLTGQNFTVTDFVCSDGVNIQGAVVFPGASGIIVVSPFSTSTLRDCAIGSPINTAGTLELYDCVFTAAVLITAAACKTDLITYRRGVLAGVSWPGNVRIVDINVPLLPGLVAIGTESQTTGNPTPAYGANELGDLFVMHVSGNKSTPEVPTIGIGPLWTKQAQKIQGNIIQQIWTRDDRATGGETGTVTVAVPGGGNLPTQAVIYTFRNVSTAAFFEALSTAGATGAGPTSIAGPTIAPGGIGRMAVLATASSGNTPTGTTVSGATGGTWVKQYEQESGLGADITLQTAALGTGSTVSGGTYSMPGTNVSQIAFALVGTTAGVPADGSTGFVPLTRAVLTTSNLTGGGDLGGDLTLALTNTLTGITSINGAKVAAPVQGTAITTTATINIANGSEYDVTAAAAYTITLGTSGTPLDGDMIVLRTTNALANAITVTNGGTGGGNLGPSGTMPSGTKAEYYYYYDGTATAWKYGGRVRCA